MIVRLTAFVLYLLAAFPVAAMELVMVEEDGCMYCARWKKDIGGYYHKTDEGAVAPVRMVDIRAVMDEPIELEKSVFYTPTFLLVDDGRELARIEGYMGDTLFWWALDMMLTEHAGFEVPTQ